jgi:Uma2 family endonuclease
VAEATLAFDRDHKGSLYARAQIPDYWLVKLIDAALEVYRDPVVYTDAPYGWRYSSPAILGPGDHVSPLAAPSVRIAVSDLLP